jgi:uncharacterized membrane protein
VGSATELGKVRGVIENKLQEWVQPKQLQRSSIQVFVIVLLILGVFFRFANLGEKIYWGDETYSSTRIAGFSQTEIIQRAYTGLPISAAELEKFQTPNSEKSLGDTLHVMVTEAPHHPPLYYIAARFWEQWFGSSLAVRRSLPVIISLLAFPSLYWLCQELFGAPLVGWIAIALFAVSPIQVLYAQEVRSYSLWVVATILSCAALLRALRLKTPASWGIYSLTLALCLYSHLFGVLIALIQAIYVVIVERLRWKSLRSYGLAAIGGILLYSPWIIAFLHNEPSASKGWGWIIATTPPDILVKIWAANLTRGFFDPSVGDGDPFQVRLGYIDPSIYLSLPLLALIAYATYFLIRNTSRRVWLLPLLLMMATTLPLVLPDLVSGGLRSTIPRYQLPSYLGLQLTLSYLLATMLNPALNSQQRVWQQRFWQIVTATLLSLGVISCVQIAQATTWWTKYSDYHNGEVAEIINQSPNPLVLSDSEFNRILALNHLLKPTVQFQLVAKTKRATEIPADQLPTISGPYSDIFLLETNPPKPLLRAELKAYKGYNFRQVYGETIGFKGRETTLWKLKPPHD